MLARNMPHSAGSYRRSENLGSLLNVLGFFFFTLIKPTLELGLVDYGFHKVLALDNTIAMEPMCDTNSFPDL